MSGQESSDREALEAFVYDHRDLERLEALLDDFNPFVALRWTRQELRHSAFLAWILDPGETHGLGDYFLRSFLKRAVYEGGTPAADAPTLLDLDTWDLSSAAIIREQSHIDLLIRDDRAGLVVAIENKVDTEEHSEQLRRYREILERQFPGSRRLCVFLTVEREEPSDLRWIPFGYSSVVELVEQALERRGDQLPSAVRAFLGQYVEMARRHIVQDSEIQQLCQRIYERHGRALDVLFEHRPDRAFEISEYLRQKIDAAPELLGDRATKSYINCIPRELDFLPRIGEGWTASRRPFLLEFRISRDTVALRLYLGPCDESLRRALWEAVQKSPRVFNRHDKRVYPKFWCFHSERWVSSKLYAEGDFEEIRAALDERFDGLVKRDLPRIVEALKQVELPSS